MGRGCPYRRKAVAAKVLSVHSLVRSYRPKATIEIRVTQARMIGMYTRLTMRRGNAPSGSTAASCQARPSP